jgi:phosphoribosylamine--glycine ligase
MGSHQKRSALVRSPPVKVLIVGSGGREHALAAGIAASPRCSELHAAPGNPGIAAIARCHPIAVTDVDALVSLARDLAVDLVVIGPEAPLVLGLADGLRSSGIAAFGPGREAARLEGSKAFAKEVMRAAGVPTAASFTVATMTEARAAIAALKGRVVVKADGLAAGKGVVVCADAEEAEQAAAAMLVGGSLGEAGRTLLIEERLEGPEVSLLAVCDGEVAVPLAPAQDFKRIGDGDTGPNTGGMGSYSPVPGFDAVMASAIVDEVHVPVLRELARRGIHFNGCLYAGLMLTADGPRVLEFNVRFGDPETQVIVPRIAADLLELLHAAATGRLERAAVALHPGAAVAVVLASRGYPASSESGVPIDGLAVAADDAEGRVAVYHAGTALAGGRVVTAGGRVLAVSARGTSIADARDRAYAAVDLIAFDGMQRRTDIAAAAALR